MFSREEKKKFLLVLVLITFAAAVYHVFDNFAQTMTFLRWIRGVLSPITVGFVMFYILNIPMAAIENNLFKKSKPAKKLKRMLSLLLTLLFVFGFMTVFVLFAVPQLGDSVNQLIEQVPTYTTSVTEFVDGQLTNLNVSDEVITEAESMWTGFLSSVAVVLMTIVNSAGTMVSSILSGVFNAVLAFVLAIYMLLGKEHLKSIISRLFRAYGPKRYIAGIIDTMVIVNRSFSNFVRGQLTEALIIGVICYIGMSLFDFEYALLISFFVGITNVIPIFGPYIGAVPSVFLLLMVNPVHALWFIVFIIVLQQIEGNLIYPRVVGDAMGISGFWIMIAVIIGNSLFGIPGILLGIPLLSSAYVIIRDKTNRRIALREAAPAESPDFSS